jgi:hypothetical protein
MVCDLKDTTLYLFPAIPFRTLYVSCIVQMWSSVSHMRLIIVCANGARVSLLQ